MQSSLESFSEVDRFDPSVNAFFEGALAAFEDAASHTGSSVREFQIADKVARLRFAGSGMIEKVTQPFSHLVLNSGPTKHSTPGDDTLTIFIWDSASTNSPLLQPPWKKDDFTPLGQVIPCSTGRYRAVYESEGRLLSVTDLATNTAIYWARDHADIPFHVRATPIRAILSTWLSQKRLEFVHAAAVGSSTGAVLIAGRGGAGKSSTAVSSLDAGLLYLSDDYCLISTQDTPQVYSVYSTAKIMSPDLSRYSIINDLPLTDYCKQTNKYLFYLAQSAPDKMARNLPIRALLFPKIGKNKTELRQVTPKESFLTIAETSSILFPYSRSRGMEVFGELSRKVPSYVLDLGPDRGDIVRVIRSFLDSDSNVKD